jgi:hypothetical protein
MEFILPRGGGFQKIKKKNREILCKLTNNGIYKVTGKTKYRAVAQKNVSKSLFSYPIDLILGIPKFFTMDCHCQVTNSRILL